MYEQEQSAARRRLLVLLIHAPGTSGRINEPVKGITRLQKLLFLTHQETDVSKQLQHAYRFSPYRFGPYSSEVYDDIEYLESFDILVQSNNPNPVSPPSRGIVQLPRPLAVEAQKRARASAPDVVEARLEYEDLFEDDIADSTLSSEFEARLFALTSYGLRRATQSLQSMPPALSNRVSESLADIKRQYNRLTLRNLLRYVYAHYPTWTQESEIAELL